MRIIGNTPVDGEVRAVASYADTQSASIKTGASITDAQSGLTAGQIYYVQTGGTLSETSDTPSVEAGLALSSSKLLIKG